MNITQKTLTQHWFSGLYDCVRRNTVHLILLFSYFTLWTFPRRDSLLFPCYDELLTFKSLKIKYPTKKRTDRLTALLPQSLKSTSPRSSSAGSLSSSTQTHVLPIFPFQCSARNMYHASQIVSQSKHTNIFSTRSLFYGGWLECNSSFSSDPKMTAPTLYRHVGENPPTRSTLLTLGLPGKFKLSTQNLQKAPCSRVLLLLLDGGVGYGFPRYFPPFD